MDILKLMDGLGNTSLKALDRSAGLESLKQGNPVSCIHSKLRDEILKTFEKVTGKNYLCYCPYCKKDSIGLFVFCHYCSRDGDPHRILHKCDAKDCWGNEVYFEGHKNHFKVNSDINYVCCHANSSPVDGSVIRTAFACVVSGYLMFHDSLIDTTRQEIMLHNVHCENTFQLHYQLCLNMATIMQLFGEFPIAKQIQEALSRVTENGTDGIFGKVFETFVSSHSSRICYLVL